MFRLYCNIVSFLFRSVINEHIHIAGIKAIEIIAQESRRRIKKKGWKCDEDMIATEYAEMIDDILYTFAKGLAQQVKSKKYKINLGGFNK
jgi:hypothetical protein